VSFGKKVGDRKGISQRGFTLDSEYLVLILVSFVFVSSIFLSLEITGHASSSVHGKAQEESCYKKKSLKARPKIFHSKHEGPFA
jgi:hypothetical protein